MANYKVVDADQLDADMTTVADAIREKGGTSEPLAWPDGYKAAVEAISRVDHTLEDGLVSRTLMEYSNDRVDTVAGYAFTYFTNLESVNFLKVTEIGEAAFRYCAHLETVNIPNATEVGRNGFASCTSLKEVAFPNMTRVGDNAFLNCEKLTNPSIPIAIAIGAGAFSKCVALERIKFPQAENLFVGAFEGCSALKTVDLPSARYLDSAVFNNCRALKSVILRKEAMCIAESNAFHNSAIANGTGYIYVPADQVNRYKMDGVWGIYTDQIRALEDYTVDGTITGELDPDKI